MFTFYKYLCFKCFNNASIIGGGGGKEKLQYFTIIGQVELNRLITASKSTTSLLDPVPTKLLKELLPVAEEPIILLLASEQGCISLFDSL